MKTEFKFSNLLGTVYSQGNLLFSPDGTCLLSPVGNRVTVFDLVNNKSYTLPFAHRKNISALGLTPQGNLLLSVDEDGRAILTNLARRITLHSFSFRSAVDAIAFSPSGRYFAASVGRHIEVWHTPSTPDSSSNGELEFAPFVRHRVYTGHYDAVQNIEWSSDSRFFLSAAKDLTARIWSVNPEEGFVPTVLAGHRTEVCGAWFSKDQEMIYTVSGDGALFHWTYTQNPGGPEADYDSGIEDTAVDETLNWRIAGKHYFMQNNAKVNCVAYDSGSNLLVAGFSNGVFCLYEMPHFNMIHTLSISQNNIDFVAINNSGEWLAFGASKLGQLLVWEWQSESYILKQQGHFDSINALVYSPDGRRIITTADDGKIKVWDVKSGFCVVTFAEHTSGVTACEFAKKGNVLFTSSLDGSIRAWDMTRFRNFRTFTAPTRLSFSCMAVDPTGEVVCAGSLDSFDVYIWSVKNGQLLDQLSGHEGPVSTIAFAPTGGILVSGSWDHTVRIWSIFSRTQTSEPLQLQADVLDVAFRPDSMQLAVSTLDGQLTFWSVTDAEQQSGVDGRRDVSGGRKLIDRRTASNNSGNKNFRAIRYSADGDCILAGGNSKYICLYSVSSLVLLKRFAVSINLSLSGTQEFLNSKLLTEAGPVGLLDDQGEASDLEDRIERTLPGSARGGNIAGRKHLPEVRISGVAFSPTGQSFCAASTEGVLIYSLETKPLFDPFDLDVTVTPSSILHVLGYENDFLKALVMSFRLNEAPLIRHVFESTPPDDIGLVVDELPVVYIPRFLRFLTQQTEESPHLEFCFLWIKAVLNSQGQWIGENCGAIDAEMRGLGLAVGKVKDNLRRLADDNSYMLNFLLNQPTQKTSASLNDSQEPAYLGEYGETHERDRLDGVSEEEWIGL